MVVLGGKSPVQAFNLNIGPITCHAFNKDRTQLAASPSSSEVHIFCWRNNKWERTHILEKHDLQITGIDWAANSNKIVTCSQDKNAFVWTYDAAARTWNPELVVVRLVRAATCVKWSPNENKFAVGSGAKVISVCYYDPKENWWIAKQIKKPIRSTVTTIDWHPNNILLAAGTCDFRTRVFSAYIKEVDDKPQPTPWGSKLPFGQLLSEVSNGDGGWVHCVKFSPSGTKVAWCGHDSSLSVAEAGASGENGITTDKTRFLPFTSIVWVSENSIVVAGHDCCPMLYSYHGPDRLEFVSKLDIPSERKASNFSAMTMFKAKDNRNAVEVDTAVATLHQNTIKELLVHSGGGRGGQVEKFTTCSIDGAVMLWDLQSLQRNVPAIRLA